MVCGLLNHSLLALHWDFPVSSLGLTASPDCIDPGPRGGISGGKCNHSGSGWCLLTNIIYYSSAPSPPLAAIVRSLQGATTSESSPAHKYNPTLDIYHSQYPHCLPSMASWRMENLTHCLRSYKLTSLFLFRTLYWTSGLQFVTKLSNKMYTNFISWQNSAKLENRQTVKRLNVLYCLYDVLNWIVCFQIVLSTEDRWGRYPPSLTSGS